MKRFPFAVLIVFVTAGLLAAAGGAAPGLGGIGSPVLGSLGGFGGPGGLGTARVVGQVYINDNTAGTNTVAGFDRHADGTLTAIPGSPFAVGGAGTGAGIASQGSLQLSADGRYLLAVDGGSNQISVARILPGGSLQIAGGGPVSSNGANPVSIAVYNSLVYVANQGTATSTGETNYTGFTLDPFGGLHAIPGSTVTLPDASKPGDVLFNNDGTRLVGTEIASSLIDSFTIGFFGHLTAAPGSPFSAQAFVPAQGFGQLGSEFSPTNPDQLFVSDAHTAAGSPAPGIVSSFTDAWNGVLAPIGASPVSNDGLASCWVEISHDGRYLYVVNTASATISSYSIAFNGALTFLQSTPAGELGGGPEDARLSPDGSTLWIVDAGTDQVSGFSVNGGTLNELPSSPTAAPAGATPAGIVVT
jgi:6-phosphogluconolactonase